MRSPAPVSPDLYLPRKRTFGRSRTRSADAAPPTPPARPEPPEHLRRQLELIRAERAEAVARMISHRTFETHFQPIVDLKNGNAMGSEALARFTERPEVSPAAWFEAAASVGLGVELELTAVEMAVEQLHRLPAAQYLSLNASVEAIGSEHFHELLADVPAERIVLELTEHTPVDDYRDLARRFQHLRSQGVRIAVDDAGAGFSSFRHILDLRPDVIKLDVALTRGIDRDPARQALGRALLTFGLEAYASTIVAEGIETEAELAVLRALGCPGGQGFYLGRPRRLTGNATPSPAVPILMPDGSRAHLFSAEELQAVPRFERISDLPPHRTDHPDRSEAPWSAEGPQLAHSAA